MTDSHFEINMDPTTPLSEDNWKREAEGVINDIKAHVKDVHVSPKITNSNKGIYLNILTLEDTKLCIELSGAGFRIVGSDYDDKSTPGERLFETPYSVLDHISPKYRESFGSALAEKLEILKDKCGCDID